MGFSDSELLALAILPKVTASLSITGSSLMARDVFKKWRGQRSNEHLPMALRAIANMCVADIGSSFWGHFLGTWMKTSGTAPFAVGNEATCYAQAFLMSFFVQSGVWCNAFLALAYYLTVCRQIPETKLRNCKYQLLLLGWPWLSGLTYALAKIISGSRGGKDVKVQPAHIWCCDVYAGSWVFVFMAVLISLGLLIILFSMGSLIRVVYLTEKKMDQFRQSFSSGDVSENRAKTLQVSKQGLSYIAAYLVIFSPVLVRIVSKLLGSPLPNGFYIFNAFIFPLQGFLNAIVYFRPKYIAARKRRGGDEGASRFGTMLGVLDLSVPGAATWLTTSLGSFLKRSSTTRQSGVTVPVERDVEDTEEDFHENK